MSTAPLGKIRFFFFFKGGERVKLEKIKISLRKIKFEKGKEGDIYSLENIHPCKKDQQKMPSSKLLVPSCKNQLLNFETLVL